MNNANTTERRAVVNNIRANAREYIVETVQSFGMPTERQTWRLIGAFCATHKLTGLDYVLAEDAILGALAGFERKGLRIAADAS